MNTRENDLTRVSLLGRLSQTPGDSQAWEEFVAQYGAKIYQWCRHWHVQDTDAQDITQQVLLKLLEKLPEFDYDSSRSFRAWLKTVVHNAWKDTIRRRKPGTAGSGETAMIGRLESLEARDDLAARLEAEFDQELLAEAMARTRLRVAPQTWQAFELTAVQGLTAEQAASQIPMQIAQVYVARRRVQKTVQEELQRLENQLTPES